MRVTPKTREAQDKMRTAGHLAAQVLDMIEPFVVPGVTTDELNARCHSYMVDELGTTPAPLDYHGFPKSICTSINHVVCHGIPSDKPLKKGDALNIDVTLIADGYHGDTSRMFFAGEPSVRARRVSDVARDSMYAGIDAVRPGAHLGDIGAAIQRYVESHRFSVVREYCGHGIGLNFHEAPQVLHYGDPGAGLELAPGMTFTIEPMVNAGKRGVKTLGDGWTVVTRDRSLSAQWEHTVLVTDSGVEILTPSECEPG